MATVLPPPSKRQRLEASNRSRDQQDIVPPDVGSLKIRFINTITGVPIGEGPILVPIADATPKNLELLINKLQGHVSYSTCPMSI
jgi:ribosome assembly protein 4